MPGLRRLYTPRSVSVEADAAGVPLTVDGVAVEAVREEWRVEDRWWTPRPLRRHYFDVALADGSSTSVFVANGRWFRQRA